MKRRRLKRKLNLGTWITWGCAGQDWRFISRSPRAALPVSQFPGDDGKDSLAGFAELV